MQPSHSPLQVPSDGTAEKASAICLHCVCYPCHTLQWEERGALQEAATLATASATPLRAHMVRSSGWGRAGEALTQQAAAQR